MSSLLSTSSTPTDLQILKAAITSCGPTSNTIDVDCIILRQLTAASSTASLDVTVHIWETEISVLTSTSTTTLDFRTTHDLTVTVIFYSKIIVMQRDAAEGGLVYIG
jgi:hypothetical protein